MIKAVSEEHMWKEHSQQSGRWLAQAGCSATKCQGWVELRVGTRALRGHATLSLVVGCLCRYFRHPLAHGLILPSLCYKYAMHVSENSLPG